MAKNNRAVQESIVETSSEAPAAVENQTVTSQEVGTIEEMVTETEVKAAPTVYDPNLLIKELGNKSKVIRYLASKGMQTNAIHKLLVGAGWHSDKNPNEKIRYQHVRNVLTQAVKKPATTSEAAKA